MNISSIVVHARPGFATLVRQRLQQLEGVEIHGASPEGKFVVTIETSSDGGTVDTFERVSALDDVLSTALVFHQFEPDPESQVSLESNTDQIATPEPIGGLKCI